MGFFLQNSLQPLLTAGYCFGVTPLLKCLGGKFRSTIHLNEFRQLTNFLFKTGNGGEEALRPVRSEKGFSYPGFGSEFNCRGMHRVRTFKGFVQKQKGIDHSTGIACK